MKRAKYKPFIERSFFLPMRPGQIERRTHNYERHGTTTLFAGLIAAVTAETDVKAGSVIGTCMPRHRAQEFRKFLDEVERMFRPVSTCMS